MPYNIYDLGDSIRVSATFTDADTLDAVDPDVVNLSIRTPDGTLTTYTYGVGGNVVKADVGQYYSIVDVNQSGSWFYRWWSTGFGQAAKEKRKPHTTALLRKSTSPAPTTDPKCCCGPWIAINICNFNKWSDEIHDAVLNGNTH